MYEVTNYNFNIDVLTDDEHLEMYKLMIKIVKYGETDTKHPAWLAWKESSKVPAVALLLSHATAFPQRLGLAVIERHIKYPLPNEEYPQ